MKNSLVSPDHTLDPRSVLAESYRNRFLGLDSAENTPVQSFQEGLLSFHFLLKSFATIILHLFPWYIMLVIIIDQCLVF